MAKIDFNTKRIGKKIHDEGEYTIPDELATGSDLTVPERFALNVGEDPHLVYDRYPGWTDEQVTAELDRIWDEEKWPELLQHYYTCIRNVKREAGTILLNSAWMKEKIGEKYGLDSDEYKAHLADREDVRVKSNEQEAKIKAALEAGQFETEWPSDMIWDNALSKWSDSGYINAQSDPGSSADAAKVQADTDGITKPSRPKTI
tara:strand:+ start:1394 stop:2002 length:609 start_codon:yes stop_codon:yes gene_type:complete